jgi:hypothetical protein
MFYNMEDPQRVVVELKLKHKNLLEKFVDDGLRRFLLRKGVLRIRR